jgi:uncharacterized protein Usg
MENNTATTVTDRHYEIASALPKVEQFIAYCNSRMAGESHITAMHRAWSV